MRAVQEIVAGLASVRDGLIAHARLSALALLAEERLARQHDRARDAVVRVEQAAAIQELLQRAFGARPAPVVWSARDREAVAALAGVELASIGPVQRALEERLLSVAAQAVALRRSCASPLAAPVAMLLDGLLPTLPQPKAASAAPARRQSASAAPARVLRGPRHVHLDPIFEPRFSMLERPDLIRARRPHEKAPFYWLAGLRESMASQLCALSMVEIDGMPLEFHRDFARQAWDEMRHALFFVEIGISLLPEFLRAAPLSHPLRAPAEACLRTGRGLPCPIERNLYEVAHACTLPQRLILMHLDTETPGISRFKRELRSPFWKARPQLARGLALSTADEASHARLGRTWLHHLLPDRERRRAEVQHTRLIRGALIVAAFSHYHERSLAALLRSVVGRPRAA